MVFSMTHHQKFEKKSTVAEKFKSEVQVITSSHPFVIWADLDIHGNGNHKWD